MAIKVRCQKCGKLSQFADIDIGLVALCIACGERFSVPPEPDETGIFPALDGTEPAEADAADASTAAPATATPADDVNAAAAALAATVGTQPVPIPVHVDPPPSAPAAGDPVPSVSEVASPTAPHAAPTVAPPRPEMIPVKPLLPRRPVVIERPEREESHALRFALLTLAIVSAIVGGILYQNAGPTWEF